MATYMKSAMTKMVKGKAAGILDSKLMGEKTTIKSPKAGKGSKITNRSRVRAVLSK